ncbi:unnamed protein product [Moneuplotes crassus]|uniref:Uncharacterized protein n=1 Tax=Euplotes crassus TaxID=5936 RepID=A0AAD2DCR8_EUPCR|nr:unnamed protein product [Moneuplotes crassus]
MTILLEEEYHQKHRNYPSLKRFGLISLVTEIESSSDESQSSEEEKKSDSDDTPSKNSSRKIIFSNKKNTSFILSFKCCKSTLQVTLDSSYYPQSENQRETQSFRCFKEKDTITYDNFKPLKLPDGLIKGDDDEDSEPEDVIRGQKFLKLHIESELEACILYLRKNNFT